MCWRHAVEGGSVVDQTPGGAITSPTAWLSDESFNKKPNSAKVRPEKG